MAGHGEKLSHKQEHTIACLLTASSIAEAAQQAGIGERTLLRWLTLAPFQAAYREARRAVVQQAVVQVQQATGVAVHTLLAVMQDDGAPASSRVAASRVVLEMAIRGVELEDMEERLSALEAHIAEAQEHVA